MGSSAVYQGHQQVGLSCWSYLMKVWAVVEVTVWTEAQVKVWTVVEVTVWSEAQVTVCTIKVQQKNNITFNKTYLLTDSTHNPFNHSTQKASSYAD